MTAAVDPVQTQRPQALATLRALFRDRPLIPLTVLLFILIGVVMFGSLVAMRKVRA